MPVSVFKSLDLPEWYITERETEKTIQRLGSIKELDFYLKNPDEHIRRLAISCLRKLSNKESVYALKEILDDPVEIKENKYLAAWVLKTLSKNREDDFLLTGRHLSYFNVYDGDSEELLRVHQRSTSKPVQFNFASSPSYSMLKLDSGETSFEKDVFFIAEFDFREWTSQVGKGLLKRSVKALFLLPKLPLKLLIIIYKALRSAYGNRSVRVTEKHKNKLQHIKQENSIQASQTTAANDFYVLRDSLYKEINQKPRTLDSIKKAGFQLLYWVFFPWRLLRRHKLAVATLLVFAFLLLANTNFGRSFTGKYMNIDLKVFQDSSIERVKEYSAYALDKFNSFLGIGSIDSGGTQIETLDNVEGQNGPLYTVTAKDGLNIRKYPDPYSEKIGTSTLTFGSTVAYLYRSHKDSAGRVWFYIKAKDGRTGWASSIFLKEMKEG